MKAGEWIGFQKTLLRIDRFQQASAHKFNKPRPEAPDVMDEEPAPGQAATVPFDGGGKRRKKSKRKPRKTIRRKSPKKKKTKKKSEPNDKGDAIGNHIKQSALSLSEV